MLSTKSKKIKNIIRSSDSRGSILSIVDEKVTNVSIITCLPKTIRSNHSHKKDWHYMYVLSGSFDYYYRPTNSNDKLQCVRVKAGELIFTPPMEDHATVFLEDCDLLAMSRNPRDQEAYEEDVRRVILINPESVNV